MCHTANQGRRSGYPPGSRTWMGIMLPGLAPLPARPGKAGSALMRFAAPAFRLIRCCCESPAYMRQQLIIRTTGDFIGVDDETSSRSPDDNETCAGLGSPFTKIAQPLSCICLHRYPALVSLSVEKIRPGRLTARRHKRSLLGGKMQVFT